MKKSKRIELSEDCISHLSIEAIHNKSNFKNYVEQFLERTLTGKYFFEANPKTYKKK